MYSCWLANVSYVTIRLMGVGSLRGTWKSTLRLSVSIPALNCTCKNIFTGVQDLISAIAYLEQLSKPVDDLDLVSVVYQHRTRSSSVTFEIQSCQLRYNDMDYRTTCWPCHTRFVRMTETRTFGWRRQRPRWRRCWSVWILDSLFWGNHISGGGGGG